MWSAQSGALNIAVLESASETDASSEIFKTEIEALFQGKRAVNFISYPITRRRQVALMLESYQLAANDPEIDFILVLDRSLNQILGRQPEFSKPTFLPYVFNAQFAGLGKAKSSSEIKNLSYFTFDVDFEKEFNVYRSIVDFSNGVLIADSDVVKNVGKDLLDVLKRQARTSGVNLSFRGYSGDLETMSLPENTDAVFLGTFEIVSSAELEQLISWINLKGIPTFSLQGIEHLQLGAFATNSPPADQEKLARRTALYMEDVLSGVPASELPVTFERSSRLTINMKTSRAIRVAPSFRILTEATLINRLDEEVEKKYSLSQVAKIAVEENLSLAVQELETKNASQRVSEARSILLPQVQSNISYSQRRNSSPLVEFGQLAENSTDASLTFRQPLFSEKAWASYAIAKYANLSEMARLREIELDITQTAVNVYLNILLAKTSLEQNQFNLEITRENYRLAKNRVDVGAASAADLYRWESEMANAQQAVLSSRAQFNQQKQQLNQLINRPINEAFSTTSENLDNRELIVADKEIETLIHNIYDLEALTNYLVKRGLAASPELEGLGADISATERQLKSDKRAFWLPEVSLNAEYTENIEENRADGGIPPAESDWFVGVELSLPLFEGGARSARTKQTKNILRQLELSKIDTRNKVEQDIRNSIEALRASSSSIDLSKVAEQAATKNFALINDAYTQGARSITEVLDAQEVLISAKESALNAVYSYLIDLMTMQRAIGKFDFFLTDSEYQEFTEQVIRQVKNQPRGVSDEQ